MDLSISVVSYYKSVNDPLLYPLMIPGDAQGAGC